MEVPAAHQPVLPVVVESDSDEMFGKYVGKIAVGQDEVDLSIVVDRKIHLSAYFFEVLYGKHSDYSSDAEEMLTRCLDVRRISCE